MVKVQSCCNSWEEAGTCEVVSKLYNCVIMIYLSNINLHSAWMLNLWTQMVAYTQVVYKDSLQTKSHQYQVYFLWKDGHLVCSSFHGCLYAHLVTDSKTIAENQWSTAAATFGAGAMKHKEEGYCSFCDDKSGWLGFHLVLLQMAIVLSVVL